MVTFFNAFALGTPGPTELQKGDTSMVKRQLSMCPQVLMEEFEGRITDSGQPVTSMAIPFASLRGAWVQDSDMKGRSSLGAKKRKQNMQSSSDM